MLFFHHLEVCFNNYNQFSDQFYNNITSLLSLKLPITDQMVEVIPHFLQAVMPGFAKT